MIKYFNGTVFNTDAKTIVNTVNCTGVMAAGIALEFALRYPDMYNDYKNKCEKKLIQVGKIDYYKNADISIVNFPTKWHFKYPSNIDWIISGLKDFVNNYKKLGIESIAFPKLGTLNGGLNWPDVKIEMEKWLSKVDIPVYICLDINDAQGIEKTMLDEFKKIDFNCNILPFKLNSKQRDTLKNSLNINRFWKIKELDGIGITTYQKIFEYCYKLATNKIYKQISFFD